jgi:hypothetical protein
MAFTTARTSLVRHSDVIDGVSIIFRSNALCRLSSVFTSSICSCYLSGSSRSSRKPRHLPARWPHPIRRQPSANSAGSLARLSSSFFGASIGFASISSHFAGETVIVVGLHLDPGPALGLQLFRLGGKLFIGELLQEPGVVQVLPSPKRSPVSCLQPSHMLLEAPRIGRACYTPRRSSRLIV